MPEPLKRRAELHGLSDDHHTALIVAVRCKRAAASGDARALERAWAQVCEATDLLFEPHFGIEEAHLLPALHQLGEGQMADRIAAEHTRLRAALSQLHPDAAAVGSFGELLDEHIRYEERVVFQAVQHRIPDAVMQALAEAWAALPRFCLSPSRE